MHAARAGRCLRRLLLGALAAGALLAWAGVASAVVIVPDPVSFDQNGVSGEIALVASGSGVPSGGNVLVGSVDGSDVSLVFEATLDGDSGTVDAIGVGAFNPDTFSGPTPTGGGDVPNGGEDVTDAGQSGSTLIFEFLTDDATPVPTLEPGETSDGFFVSYESLAQDGSLVVNFMISPGDGSDFTVSSTIVPEPATLGMVGLGLAGLGWASRRRRG